MKRLMSGLRYGDKGFTLVELLVVIGIIGALSAVVVPNAGSFLDHGKTEAMQTEFHNIQLAMHAGTIDNNLTSITHW